MFRRITQLDVWSLTALALFVVYVAATLLL